VSGFIVPWTLESDLVCLVNAHVFEDRIRIQLLIVDDHSSASFLRLSSRPAVQPNFLVSSALPGRVYVHLVCSNFWTSVCLLNSEATFLVLEHESIVDYTHLRVVSVPDTGTRYWRLTTNSVEMTTLVLRYT
jgi:hypothetical protein